LTRPPISAWFAFAGMVLFAGANVVVVKISNEELAPFWGAFLRFFLASMFFLLYVTAKRIPMPQGRALVGAVIYGTLSFGLSYAILYTVLRHISSGLLSVFMAIGPLLTIFLASMHGLERIRVRAVAGGVLAVLGMAAILRQQIQLDAPLAYLALALLGLLVMTEAGVLVKYFPRPHPAALNAVGMLIGSVLLLVFSLVADEAHAAPTTWRNALAVGYLVLGGSIGLFGLFLYAIARLDVSVVAYQFVLMPIVTITLAQMLVGESFTPTFLVGGLVVAAGVFLAITRPRPKVAAAPAVIAHDAAPQSGASTSDAPRP
jgi:drug/metabolite transporter (DMT)-like permease